MSLMYFGAIFAAVLVIGCSGQALGEGDNCPDGSPAKDCETVPCERCPKATPFPPFPAVIPPLQPVPPPSPSAPSEGDDCPEPAPLCLIFPCDPRVAKCTAVPDAQCRVDCACGFFFVDDQDNVLKCEDPDLDPVCSLPPDMGPCEAAIQQWFFNINTGQCETFTYGGCEGNGNRFNSQEECQNSRCGSPGGVPMPDPTPPPPDAPDVCGLPKDGGSCSDLTVRYYFNTASKRCEPFKYTGCGGNGNNFQTAAECLQTCDPVNSQCTQRGGGCGPSSFECCEGLRCCFSNAPFRFARRVGLAGTPSIVGACIPYCG